MCDMSIHASMMQHGLMAALPALPGENAGEYLQRTNGARNDLEGKYSRVSTCNMVVSDEDTKVSINLWQEECDHLIICIPNVMQHLQRLEPGLGTALTEAVCDSSISIWKTYTPLVVTRISDWFFEEIHYNQENEEFDTDLLAALVDYTQIMVPESEGPIQSSESTEETLEVLEKYLHLPYSVVNSFRKKHPQGLRLFAGQLPPYYSAILDEIERIQTLNNQLATLNEECGDKLILSDHLSGDTDVFASLIISTRNKEFEYNYFSGSGTFSSLEEATEYGDRDSNYQGEGFMPNICFNATPELMSAAARGCELALKIREGLFKCACLLEQWETELCGLH